MSIIENNAIFHFKYRPRLPKFFDAVREWIMVIICYQQTHQVTFTVEIYFVYIICDKTKMFFFVYKYNYAIRELMHCVDNIKRGNCYDVV